MALGDNKSGSDKPGDATKAADSKVADEKPGARVKTNELGEVRPPLGIALEGDFGARIDAVLAVAMLNGFTAKGEARRLVLSSTRPTLVSAQVADVLAEYYPVLPENAGYSTIGLPDGLGDGPPGALAHAGQDNPGLVALLSRVAADGRRVYPTRIARPADTADSAVLLRNGLLSQFDGNAAVVLAGPARNLARLLGFHGSRAQIAAKVQRLVVAVGEYPTGPADPTLASDVLAFRKLFAEWPTPLIAVGQSTGDLVRYSTLRLVQSLASVPAHPLVSVPAHPLAAVTQALVPQPADVSTTALAALLHAVHPDADFFTLSEPGTIQVQDDGRTRFVPHPGGNHRYLSASPAQKARLLETYAALVTAAPAPRPVRRKREMVDKDKPKAEVAQSEAGGAATIRAPGAAAGPR
jgi:hypothetical protein